MKPVYVSWALGCFAQPQFATDPIVECPHQPLDESTLAVWHQVLARPAKIQKP